MPPPRALSSIPTPETQRLEHFRAFLDRIPQTEWPHVLGASLWALFEIVGLDAALALAAQHGGDRLNVPSLAHLERRARDTAIRQARKAGATQVSLARRYGLSERQIHNILKSAP